MHVLYIHQYFCTRSGRSGTRSYEFARHLVRRGHRVTMLTSTSELSDVRLPRGQRTGRMTVDGIEVIAVNVEYSQRMGAVSRTWSFVRFMTLSTWIACRERGYDVVVATSTPLTVGVPGMVASIVRRRPLVFEVRDLWPEAPIQLGFIRNPIVIALLRAFERTVYRWSTRIIALSPGMAAGILAAKIAPDRVCVIPNCSDLDLFTPGAPDPQLVARLQLEGRFVVGYAGSLGAANDVDVLLAAASALQDRPEIVFLIVGSGSEENLLKQRVAESQLDNVRFVGSLPRRDVAGVLRVFDTALVLFKNLPILATNSPNKLFDALAAGRPLIVNSDGWTRELVEANGVGRYAEPGSGESLAAQIRWLCDHPESRREMGRRARVLAEAEFDRARLARRFESELQAACSTGTHPIRETDAPTAVSPPRRSVVASSVEIRPPDGAATETADLHAAKSS